MMWTTENILVPRPQINSHSRYRIDSSRVTVVSFRISRSLLYHKGKIFKILHDHADPLNPSNYHKIKCKHSRTNCKNKVQPNSQGQVLLNKAGSCGGINGRPSFWNRGLYPGLLCYRFTKGIVFRVPWTFHIIRKLRLRFSCKAFSS